MVRNVFSAFCILVMISVLTVSGNAVLSEVDLYPGTGDGLLTRSTKTGLDWLDLTVSKGYTYKAIVGGAGNIFASGFRYATYKETQNLFAEFGIPWYDIKFRRSTLDPALKFLRLLGETGDTGKQHRFTQGMTNSFYKGDSPPTSHSPYVQIDTSNNTARGYISRHTAYEIGNFGGYLVRSKSYEGPTTVTIPVDSYDGETEAEVKAKRKTRVGKGLYMETEATLYRNGLLVMETDSWSKAEFYGLKGHQVFVVCKDRRANAIWVSRNYTCKTVGGTLDPSTKSRQHNVHREQFSDVIGKHTVAMDIYHSSGSLTYFRRNIIRGIKESAEIVDEVKAVLHKLE